MPVLLITVSGRVDRDARATPMTPLTLLQHRLAHHAAPIAVIGALVIAFIADSAWAQAPPSKDCRSASKIEYESAQRQHLLRNRYGMYVRTGRGWRRHYWYCHVV